MTYDRIMTVGISPCWDIECRVDGIHWGDHKKMSGQTCVPAGKALNVSKALAWMGTKSTAAGLWGAYDFQQMLHSPVLSGDAIDIQLTRTPGRTRQNITVVDTHAKREIHLRAESELATLQTLETLRDDLEAMIKPSDAVIFSGSLPANFIDACLDILKTVDRKGARIILDTSGPELKRVIEAVPVYLIKPNLEELRLCLDQSIAEDTASVVTAARTLCDRVGTVVVSLGERGAVAVTKDRAVHGYVRAERDTAVRTVGCGDYLLAGVLGGLKSGGDLCEAFVTGIQVATARARGLTETMGWPAVQEEIPVEITQF